MIRRRNWKADACGAWVAAALAFPTLVSASSAAALPAASGAGQPAATSGDGADRPYPLPGAAEGAPPSLPADPEAFALSAVETAVERDAPEICAQFSNPPDPEQPAADLIALWTEDGAAAPVNLIRRGKALCLGGLEHGKTYRVSLSADLRAVNGRNLGEPVERLATVAERRPSLVFRDAGFLLTRIGDGRGDPELALRSINLPTATLRLLRLTEFDGLERVYFEAGDPALVERLAKDAREVWSGAIALGGQRNRPTTTPLPLDALVGKLEPGVYVAAAEGGGERSQQWFIVSDLAINTVVGDDGLLVFARNRATAEPLEGATLRVVARDRSEAAQTRTGADGLARIDSAQLSGAGERAPQVLMVRRGANVAVMELSGPRNAVGAEADENPFQRSRLDAFVAPDRPSYAPGDAVNLTALLRDVDGREAAGEKLVAELRRPDGALAQSMTLDDAGGGGYVFAMRLPATAQPGDWRLILLDESGGDAVGETTLRVDDARPLGLSLGVEAARVADGGDGGMTPAFTATVRALNAAGRPAVGLTGRLYVAARRPQGEYPQHGGYSFGQDAPPTDRKLLGAFTIGADGKATVQAAGPDGLPYHSAFDARIEAEIAASGAAAARAETVLPYRPRHVALGLRPRFEGGGVPDNATVAFDVLAVDGPTGRPVEAKGLTYELVREETAFEWFDNQGRWDYRPAVRDRATAGGAVDVSADAPAAISEPVAAGVYRLDVRDPATGAVASRRFTAGWWLSPRAGARPDRVEVSAIRPGARAEGKAWVFIRPPYASEVLILVADQRVRRAETRAVGSDGAFIEIPADYGSRAGAHVLAAAFATPDPAYRGPPRRAAGSAWLPSADGPRRLPLTVEAAGQGEAAATAPVAVNVRVRVPDFTPTGVGGHVVAALLPMGAAESALGDPALYFFGERPLGVGLRDLYGRLISPPDRSGARSGGVTGASRAGALRLSPVTALDAGGEAALTLTPPPGTPAGEYRVVVLAWDGQTMGRAETALTLPAAAPLPPAAASLPAGPWRKTWVGELGPGGETVRPQAAGPETAALLLTESAAAIDLDLGEAAGRLASPLPPPGALAAAARLVGLTALRLPEAARDAAATQALDELLAMQRPDGAFAVWGPTGPADPWLTAFAVDALGRWRRVAGTAPEPQIKAARDWLRRWWDGCWTDPANLPACAYALSVLTETKRLDAAATAFFADSFAVHLPNDLARAHLAAAYDNVGDRRQAEAAFARVSGGRRVDAATRDYGSSVRDAAAAVAVMAERRAPADALNAAAGRLQRTRATAYSLNDQESAWLIAAAAGLSPPGQATNGQTPSGQASNGPSLAPFPAGPLLRNGGTTAARFVMLTPDEGRTADDAGKLTLRFADLTGATVDPATLAAGDAVAATVTATFPPEDWPRVVRLSAPLPDNAEPVAGPALTGDGVGGALGLLRGRFDKTGATAAAAIPPGVGSISMTFLFRATRDGAASWTATLEPFSRPGRLARLVGRPEAGP